MVIYFSYTNGSHEFSVEFCVLKFQVLGETTMDKGIRSSKSLRLGMPKAPQGNIQGILKHLSLGVPLVHRLTKRNIVKNVMVCFVLFPLFEVYCTNGSHEVFVEFCVLKFSSFG